MSDNKRIVLNTNVAIHLIPVENILYCKSDNSYTTFYTCGHEPIVVSKNIKEFECQLSNRHFFRPHQSYLVNLDHVIKIDKQDGFTLQLSDQSRVPTSTRKKKELLQILERK